MKDTEIIDLFFVHSEEALRQVQKKYGYLCRKIAWNILRNEQDADECVNDAYLVLWNQIPPNQPNPLKTYLCCIIRNTALKKFRSMHTQKRYSKELTRVIEHFLDTLGKEKRTMFVKRYWLCESVKEIAEEYGITEKHASVKLGRIRCKLKKYLEKEGWL
ncbi:MAG: sigma-70 family RNA polymerase sigma factor [Lachnospiraceae bacterium]|nr:sigma-70 family RNA polymerase sigma factor [Lachnospiraceae bacterium]